MLKTNTTARTIARTMTTSDLQRVARALETELLADMDRGVMATQAHLGKIELMNACTDEIVDRVFQIATA